MIIQVMQSHASFSSFTYFEDIEITLRPSPCDGGPGGCLEQKLSGFFTNVISRKEQLLPISSVIHIAMVMATTSPQHVVFCRCGEKGNLKAPTGRLGWSSVAK